MLVFISSCLEYCSAFVPNLSDKNYLQLATLRVMAFVEILGARTQQFDSKWFLNIQVVQFHKS